MRILWLLSVMLAGAVITIAGSARAESIYTAPPDNLPAPPPPPETDGSGELVMPADQSLTESLKEAPPVHIEGAVASEPPAIPTPKGEPYYDAREQQKYGNGIAAELGHLPPNGPCGDYVDCCRSCGPNWSVTGEAVWLQRDETDAVPLVTLGGATIFSVSDIDFDYETGWRIGATRYGCGQDMEFSFLGIDTMDRTAIVGPAGSEFSGYGITLGADPYTFAYEQELYSAEWNVRQPTCGPVTWLLGLRYLELNERLLVSSVGLANAVDANTDNRLYGAQVGAVRDLFDDCAGFSVEGYAKAGVYHNDADYRAVRGLNAAATFGEANHTSFVGELGVNARFQVNDRVAIRGGYQAMWIEGVALAPEQSPRTDLVAQTASLDTNGGVFYHGGFVGVELAW